MSKDLPSEKDATSWIARVRADVEALNHKLAPLLEERERLKRQLEVLERLRDSLKPPKLDDPPPRERIPRSASVRDYVISRAIELLDEEAGPLHINEIHARFLKKGYEVPGAGAAVNITAHIRHSDAIVSPSKGVYMLAVHADGQRKKN